MLWMHTSYVDRFGQNPWANFRLGCNEICGVLPDRKTNSEKSTFFLCMYNVCIWFCVVCWSALFNCKTSSAISLHPFCTFARSVSFSKYESGINLESRTAAKTVDSSVWSKWESWALPELLKGDKRARWARRTMVDGTDLLIRWVWGGLRTESPLCCPGWNFVLEKCLTFSNPNCTQWGASSFPLPTGLVTALTPGPEEGVGIWKLGGDQ